MALHLHAWEEPAQVEGHHLFQGHGGEDRWGLAAAEIGGDFDEPRQDFLRHLDPGKFLLAGFWIPD